MEKDADGFYTPCEHLPIHFPSFPLSWQTQQQQQQQRQRPQPMAPPLPNLSMMQMLVSPATIPENPSQIATFSSNRSHQVHLRGLGECFRKLYARQRVPIVYPFSPYTGHPRRSAGRSQFPSLQREDL